MPRFHHQLLPHQVEVEAAFDETIAGELKRRGHALVRSPQETIREIHAVSDGRKHGKAAGY
ncbi:hypothetical protein SYNPS1DRAFT_23883 [Syncephalis pseudoplumigaleata]|uniref:Uncharacterized protein n=1 Tax=Syncephalis pseudoplumigaleata TaxID=1712513 RepID=A0A4P9YYE5_9FUNG|nr:hypothetical protein SYNPS1DRAFT_23883 [Syncephalis pseudoplumigaleata]|eukprot:RKP24020.1 hypothetical protein SYNPS1DRAFT_23883 [Syncephalis pseudoplumigaleata]